MVDQNSVCAHELFRKFGISRARDSDSNSLLEKYHTLVMTGIYTCVRKSAYPSNERTMEMNNEPTYFFAYQICN